MFLWFAFVVELLFEALIGQKKLESGAVIDQKQVKHEREPKEQEIPILDISHTKLFKHKPDFFEKNDCFQIHDFIPEL